MKVIGYVFDQPNGCYQYKYYFEGSLQKYLHSYFRIG